MLGVGGHLVGGDDPAPLAEQRREVEDGEAGFAGQAEAHDREVRRRGQHGEVAPLGQLAADPPGRRGERLHDLAVAALPEPDEVVVLRHDLGGPTGEVEAEVGVAPAEVVDLEDELLR